ncbi:MAG: hypothetical protein JW785_07555 [Acidimicrobiia bacterium]|nr:hypothetical protein [Acidimicrobiia bacterium]
MSSHTISVAIYLSIALVGVGLQLAARMKGSRIPSLGRVFARIMSTRPGRVGVMAAWAWLGLHFFAR